MWLHIACDGIPICFRPRSLAPQSSGLAGVSFRYSTNLVYSNMKLSVHTYPTSVSQITDTLRNRIESLRVHFSLSHLSFCKFWQPVLILSWKSFQYFWKVTQNMQNRTDLCDHLLIFIAKDRVTEREKERKEWKTVDFPSAALLLHFPNGCKARARWIQN